MKSVRNITVIHHLKQVDLFKDVGMVAYHLAKVLGSELTFVFEGSYDIVNPFEHVVVRIVKVISARDYLREHAHEIDLLMLYHVKTSTIRLGTLYKELNLSGFLYVKYDIELAQIPYLHDKPWYAPARYRRRHLFRGFAPKVNLLSVECYRVYERMTEFDRRKLFHLPNGTSDDIIINHVPPGPDEPKQKLLLLVGRHGSHQKNSEMIFDLLPKLGDLRGWKVRFVGPATEQFIQLAKQFVSVHPEYADDIELTGNITDRSQLLLHYRQARILCLPSRTEGFPLVCAEAMYFGVVVCMSSELTSSFDITNHGEAGFRIPRENLDEWAAVLHTLFSDTDLLDNMTKRSQVHFRNYLDWNVTVPRLAERITTELST